MAANRQSYDTEFREGAVRVSPRRGTGITRAAAGSAAPPTVKAASAAAIQVKEVLSSVRVIDSLGWPAAFPARLSIARVTARKALFAADT